MSNTTLYDRDFHAWAGEQAALLRAGRLAEADIAHIAEEIESMGRGEKRELISRLKVLLVRLLKWRFQPAGRGNSWRLTIAEQRREVADHLDDNPSLRAQLDAAIVSAYGGAILAAARETGLDPAGFPPACPWAFAAIMDAGFWPGEA